MNCARFISILVWRNSYYEINASYNWSYNDNISGNWNFNFYVTLPPPVSFISLNFAISLQYSIPINLNTNGQLNLPVAYTCTFTSSFDPYVYLDSSAVLGVGVAEGGAYISGVVLNVKTDPKITLAYFLQSSIVVITVDWKFHLKPFSFNWGFRYRFKKLFGGWGPWKYIGPYTVSVNSQQSFQILAFTKQYKL